MLTKSIATALALLVASAATAQTLPFDAAPAGIERPDVGPSYALSHGGLLFIADEVNGAVLIYDGPDLQNRVGEVPYPAGISNVRRIESDGATVRLLDQNGLAASLALPASLALGAQAIPPAEAALVGERSFAGISLRVGSLSTTLSPYVPGRWILDWRLVGERDGATLITWNELDGTSVFAIVARVSTDGSVEVVGEVDLGNFDYIVGNPVHLASDGSIWLLGLKDGIWTHPLDSVSVPSEDRALGGARFFDPSASDDRSLAPNALEDLARAQREIRDDSLGERNLDDYEIIDNAMIGIAGIEGFQLRKSSVTRSEVVARALTYHSLPFFYRIKNHREVGGRFKRPPMLNDRVSSWVVGFRYYWGGYMSPLRHQEGLIRGDVVGNIDTSGAPISEGIIGCDCSGCVSAWLGIPRHTTSGIGTDLDDLFRTISLAEMEPGDLFNKAGSHVRMLLNRIDGTSGTSFRIIESSVSCQGVCIKTFSVEELRGYTPTRYRGVTD